MQFPGYQHQTHGNLKHPVGIPVIPNGNVFRHHFGYGRRYAGGGYNQQKIINRVCHLVIAHAGGPDDVHHGNPEQSTYKLEIKPAAASIAAPFTKDFLDMPASHLNNSLMKEYYTICFKITTIYGKNKRH